MNHLPSLTALRCLDASARLRSFTLAAREVHLTQGAVSQQILGLEAQLGVPVFLRRRGGLELTAAGKSYWAEVSAALRQIERATQNMVTHQGNGGTLNLCVASSFATYWLMPRLGAFVARHPEVTLNISTHIGPVDFASSPHDAAIEFCDGPAPGLHAVLVHPLVLQPYASPALLAPGKKAAVPGKASLTKLLESRPLIRHTTLPEAWTGWLAGSGLRLGTARAAMLGPQYDLLSMALNGAIAGLGIALLPDYMTAHALATASLARISEHAWQSQRGYYLRYPEWKGDTVVLQRFQQWLLEVQSAS